MSDLAAGLAFFFIIEGLLYAAAPGFVKSLAAVLPEFAESQLRIGGIVAMGIGVFGMWLIRGL
jgi:uncharacterized protein